MPVSASATVDVYNDSEAKYFVNGEDILLYRLILPENYNSNKSYPLLLFLHGAGERGSDNTRQLQNCVQAIANYAPNAIIVAPQCPEGNQWVDTPWANGAYSTDTVPESNELKSVMLLLDKIKTEYSVDSDRVYACGISMGGFGTWDLITRHPDTFAAAIPVCGGGDPSNAAALKDIPIYTFHGDADPSVPVAGTRATVDAIKAAGGTEIEYTEYAGGQHGIWDMAFATTGLFDKLLKHKLSDRPTAAVSSEVSSEPVTSVISSEPSSEVTSVAPPSSEIEKAPDSNGYIYIIIIAAVVIIAAVAVVIVTSKKKKDNSAV